MNAKNTGKECAYIAVFVALLVAVQLTLSALPGVELVTVLFTSYAFTFGGRRGMISATAFSLLRQLVFGFFPTVLILYLVYYNLLAWLFGRLGKRGEPPKGQLLRTAVACVCTLCFSALDNIIAPLWYGYSGDALRAYFIASLSFAIPQVVNAALTVGFLFLPLQRAFAAAKKGLS